MICLINLLQAKSDDPNNAQLYEELEQTRNELAQSKEEVQRASTETERLLQLVQMSQEEQNAKEKQIMDLQQ